MSHAMSVEEALAALPEEVRERILAGVKEEEADQAVIECSLPRRKRCGAHCRSTGKPCQMWTLPGRMRCRLHGGLSTGPKGKKAPE